MACRERCVWATPISSGCRRSGAGSVKINYGGVRCMDDDFEPLKDHLEAINKELATARELLAHYEMQLGKQD